MEALKKEYDHVFKLLAYITIVAVLYNNTVMKASLTLTSGIFSIVALLFVGLCLSTLVALFGLSNKLIEGFNKGVEPYLLPLRLGITLLLFFLGLTRYIPNGLVVFWMLVAVLIIVFSWMIRSSWKSLETTTNQKKRQFFSSLAVACFALTFWSIVKTPIDLIQTGFLGVISLVVLLIFTFTPEQEKGVNQLIQN